MDKWGQISFAMVVISLIAACTYTVNTDGMGDRMRICTSAGYEWIDGDCVRGKP